MQLFLKKSLYLQRIIDKRLIITVMENKIVALKDYKSMADAGLDKAVLEENGIESFVGNQQAAALYPMFKDIDEGMKIYVFEQDYEKALKLLEDYHSADEKGKE